MSRCQVQHKGLPVCSLYNYSKAHVLWSQMDWNQIHPQSTLPWKNYLTALFCQENGINMSIYSKLY